MPGASVSSQVRLLQPQDHACSAYTSVAEHRALVTAYMTAGLELNERVVFLGGPGERGRLVAGYLRESGVDVDRLTGRDQLRFVSAADEYLAGGTFVPDERLSTYAEAVRQSVRDGYTGLRVFAEVSFLAGHPQAKAEWPAYEFRADLMAAAMPFTALCAYDGEQWHPDELAVVESVHSLVLRDDRAPLDTRFRLHGAKDGSIHLGGELDRAFADRVGAMITAAAGDREHPVLDLSALGFVDVAGLRAVGRAAQALAEASGAVTIRGASAMFRRLWQLAAYDRLYPGIVVR